MLGRIFAIAMNSYREAVRARVLVALLFVGIGVSLYSLVIAAMSLRGETRIVADLGAAVTSLAAIGTTIVLGATSLYRELELKTIFPILTRKLRRHEYIVGKYFGILATMLTFVAIQGAVTLAILGYEATSLADHKLVVIVARPIGFCTVAILFWRATQRFAFFLLPWSIALFVVMALLAEAAGAERQVVVVSALLTLAEVAIIAAIATFFSSFSSPFLTAIFTLMVFLIGRSSDTLANLPAKLFGDSVHDIGVVLAKVVPNLNVYVPPRPLLLGQLPNVPVGAYVARAWANAIGYAVVLLSFSALVFRKRDFQ